MSSVSYSGGISLERKTLITITRQYGSGGREVAEILAKRLGVKRYDRKVVAMAAKALGQGTEEDFQFIMERSYNSPENCLGNLGDFAYERVPQHNRMYIEQAKVILRVAKEGSAVFLGRCADYILRADPDAYSFFIYADDDFRLERAKTHYGNRSLKDLDAEDKNRKQYYAYYTGEKWGDPKNFDLMINTGKLGLSATADLILQYIDLRRKK